MLKHTVRFLVNSLLHKDVFLYKYIYIYIYKSSRNGPVHELSWFFSRVGIWLKYSTLCCHSNEATVMREHIAYCCLHIL